jgi:hypothetical protein
VAAPDSNKASAILNLACVLNEVFREANISEYCSSVVATAETRLMSMCIDALLPVAMSMDLYDVISMSFEKLKGAVAERQTPR